jgi:hypothetical protein
MKRSVFGLLGSAAIGVSLMAVSALTPQAIAAQSWSVQEQEAIDHLRACWETWSTEDYDAWVETCNLDPSGSYWSSEELAPNPMETGHGYLRDIVLQTLQDGDVVAWDIRPIKVTTWGDVVAVYFYGIMHLRDSDGTDGGVSLAGCSLWVPWEVNCYPRVGGLSGFGPCTSHNVLKWPNWPCQSQ